ncbi:hypothetical protein C121_19 [Stenotrophomonas phage C121]|uniref:hypothetical protein n=1 Tax=Stenotrophomonas phage C121 TaxID=2914029 RepID=UPI0023295981|nr:hypothetical protein PP752_gp19 [Stenotrophomonas phage C121]UKL14752.1 hypothetical protein C121_19 [Stenotrophomonas phage C121]
MATEQKKVVFCFGSNTHGIHGAGAAQHAYKHHGARWGMGYGHYGDSFAIPTKGCVRLSEETGQFVIGEPLPLGDIYDYVGAFKAYARHHPELTFKVTRIGCGLAGFTDAQMSSLFIGAPLNCQFDEAWKIMMGNKYTYWGTM